MANTDFPDEMGNIPYSRIIGGPLSAAVEANAEASETAADFIRDVGFTDTDSFNFFSDQKEPVYVTFHYIKEVQTEDGSVEEREFEMRVPLLLLLHIPYFEVDLVTIDFNVKLNSIEQRSREFETGGGAGVVGSLFGASLSAQYSSKRAEKVERTYDQSVHVEAGSIEPPEGVTRVFDVLEQTITEQVGESEDGNGD